MTVLLVIGPSGVGKTSCARRLSQRKPGRTFVDLDAEIAREGNARDAGEVFCRVGPHAFFEIGRSIVDRLDAASGGSLVLVAVGAGSLEAQAARAWLASSPTILVWAPPAEVLPRNPLGPKRSLSNFTAQEYGAHRQVIYQRSRFRVDVSGLDEEAAQARFEEIVEGEVLAWAAALGANGGSSGG